MDTEGAEPSGPTVRGVVEELLCCPRQGQGESIFIGSATVPLGAAEIGSTTDCPACGSSGTFGLTRPWLRPPGGWAS
jgi:hypothetical protein